MYLNRILEENEITEKTRYRQIDVPYVDSVIRSSWDRTRQKHDVQECDEVIFELTEIISNCKGIGWADLVVTRAGLQIEAGRPYEAANFLRPKLKEGAQLVDNCFAHNVFVSALNAMNWFQASLVHLQPRLQQGELLYGNPTANFSFVKALTKLHKQNEVVNHLGPQLEMKGVLYGHRVAHTLFGSALNNLKKRREALNHFEPLIDTVFVRDKRGLTFYADLLTKENKCDQAIAFLEPRMQRGAILDQDPWARDIYRRARGGLKLKNPYLRQFL